MKHIFNYLINRPKNYCLAAERDVKKYPVPAVAAGIITTLLDDYFAKYEGRDRSNFNRLIDLAFNTVIGANAADASDKNYLVRYMIESAIASALFAIAQEVAQKKYSGQKILIKDLKANAWVAARAALLASIQGALYSAGSSPAAD